MTTLPIAPYQGQLVDAIATHDALVVVGDTGCGKTTQIPIFLFNHSRPRIVCTQPRRIAAISAANRVAWELNSKVGSLVGYKVRFEKCLSLTDKNSEGTRIIYMTDGVLLRECVSDPLLSSYDIVLLDEAHERSLETDVLFGLLKQTCRLRISNVEQHGLKPLKVVIMSATLDVEKFSDFFDECPVFTVPGRMYEVEILWQKKMKLAALKSSYLERSINTVMHIHKDEEPGDILVFLTGQQEIEQACKRVIELHRELDYRKDVKYSDKVKGLISFPIYGSLETLEQRSIFEDPPNGIRKIVFATNIAQTSVTIPGIRYVVDSGFVKQKMYDPATSMDALVVVPISQATATQRAGRAGRTTTGKVYRLYSRDSFEEMEPETLPEIQRSSLIGTVLQLKKMGIHDILSFEFIDPPDMLLLAGAGRQLYMLGALDEQGKLTKLGDLMSNFPISPFLSTALLASSTSTVSPHLPTGFHCSDEILTIISMLSTEEVFIKPRNPQKTADAAHKHAQFGDKSGDHLMLYNVYEAWKESGYSEKFCREFYLHFRALKVAKNIREQVEEIMNRLGVPIVSCRREKGKRKRNEGESISSKSYKRGRDDERDERKGGKYDERSFERQWEWNETHDVNFKSSKMVDSTVILKSLCAGFFMHVAKRHVERPIFYHYLSTKVVSNISSTSAGSHLMALTVHPNSCLGSGAGKQVDFEGLDWVLYNDIQLVNRAAMRCVSSIEFGWVKEYFQQVLENVPDARVLIGSGEVDVAALDVSERRLSNAFVEGQTEDQVEDNDDARSVNSSDFDHVKEVVDEQHKQEKVVRIGKIGEVLKVDVGEVVVSAKNMRSEVDEEKIQNEKEERKRKEEEARERYLKRKRR
ncbi:DEAH-box ATP-dependent RNA helicase prp22 [Nowakowskiella sp. JEL0407]|nr:DEAH-box ATP-dependent RNA helicase prp22 [Nowakowskiella sp. JEL0407]